MSGIAIAFAIAFACVAGLLLLRSDAERSADSSSIFDYPRCAWDGPHVECGAKAISAGECVMQACCWIPATPGAAALPSCFRPNAGASTYDVASATGRPGSGGLRATLRLSRATQPELGPDVATLALDVEEVSDSILRVKLTDAAAPRWEVPPWLFRGGLAGSGGGGHRAAAAPRRYALSYARRPFSFRVARAGSGGCGATVIFDTGGTRLMFKEQYLELTTWADPALHFYGAGERASASLHLARDGVPRPLWSRDLWPDPGASERNSYGSHPFILALDPDGMAWGALLLSANALEIVPGRDRLSWRVTGGVLNLWLFAGPSPAAVMDQYTSIVGRPALPPFWACGFHQCKWGYRSVWEVEAVVANYSAAHIPLEAIWTDIDHMDGMGDWGWRATRGPSAQCWGRLHGLIMPDQRSGPSGHLAPPAPCAGKVDPGYAPYEEGLQQHAFIRDAEGHPYMAWVWPGACHFPDFLSRRGQAYIARQLAQHRTLVPWTVSVLATHRDGTLEYNAHNLFGLSSAKAVSEAVGTALGARPFVLTRSTFPGVGAFAAHWGGDNTADWTNLAFSIPGVLSSGLAGIPMAGADICGFGGETTEELRDHSGLGTYQELYRWPLVADTARKVLRMRYRRAWVGWERCGRCILLPYLYSALWAASRTGAPVMRPLWLDFPAERATHENARQFMLGDALLVTPVLEPGAQNVSGYLPGGTTWYSLWHRNASIHSRHGHTTTFPAPFGEPPIHIRGGAALPLVPLRQPAPTTREVRASPLTVVAALPAVLAPPSPLAAAGAAALGLGPPAASACGAAGAPLRAYGEMYLDDGELLEVGSGPCHVLTLAATVAPTPGTPGVCAGELLLLFGEHAARAAGPSTDSDGAAGGGTAGGPPGAEWPALGAVEVLGWQLPVQEPVALEVVWPRPDGSLETVKSMAVPPGAVTANGVLRIDLSGLGSGGHQLECPAGVRIAWASPHPAAAAAEARAAS
eukprot:scaffold10.g2350.t1